MNRLEVFSGKRVSFPVTERLKGLNSLITTKDQLAFDIGTYAGNIKNLTFDDANNEITWHTVNPHVLKDFAFSINQRATSRQVDLANAIEEFETEKIDLSNAFRTFDRSNIRVLKSTFTNIGKSEGLENMRKIKILELPNLIHIDNRSLNNLGINNGGFPVMVDFPKLKTIGFKGISGNFKTVSYWNNMTFVHDGIFHTNFSVGWRFQEYFPFDLSLISNAIFRSDQFMQSFKAMADDIDLPMYSGTIGRLSFTNLLETKVIKLDNATQIIEYVNNRSKQDIFNNIPKLELISLKGVKSMPTNNRTSILRNVPSNVILNIHNDLKNYDGNGNIHPYIQDLITNYNWTVNWYDNSQTLVSTTN